MSNKNSTVSRIHFQDELTWKELDELPRDRTLFILTIAPLQAYGPHLPTGLGGFSSQAFAVATAKEFCRRRSDWHAVLAPHIPLGSFTYKMVGSMDIRPVTIRRTLEDLGASIARDGFGLIVVISTHAGPGHIKAVEDACERVSRKHDIDMIAPMGPKIFAYLSGSYDQKLQRLARGDQPHSYAQDIHAGRFDTSMALFLRPDLVKPGYTDLKPVLIDPEELGPDSPATAGTGQGYLGSPHLASAELGKAGLEAVARDFTELLFRILKGEDVMDRVCSPFEGVDILYEYSHLTVLVLSVIALSLLVGLVGLWYW